MNLEYVKKYIENGMIEVRSNQGRIGDVGFLKDAINYSETINIYTNHVAEIVFRNFDSGEDYFIQFFAGLKEKVFIFVKKVLDIQGVDEKILEKFVALSDCGRKRSKGLTSLCHNHIDNGNLKDTYYFVDAGIHDTFYRTEDVAAAVENVCKTKAVSQICKPKTMLEK